jgi:hypothetical protein
MNLRDPYLIIAPDFIGQVALEHYFITMGYGIKLKKGI